MLFLLAIPTAALTDSGKVSLSEAIDMALENNHLLKASAFEHTAANHGVSVAFSRYFPRISLNETFSASNSPTNVFMMKLDEGRFSQNDISINNLNHPDAQTDFLTSFTIEQPLFDYTIGRAVEISEKEAGAKGLTYERRREDTGFAVFAAYLEVQKAKDFLGVAERAVTDAREHERLARVRTGAGTGLKSDELRAQTFLAEMEQQNISAKNGAALARLRLARAAGAKPGAVLDIRDDVTTLPIIDVDKDLARLAVENRQDLKAAGMARDKADAGIKAAWSGYLPTVYGTAAYRMNDRDAPFGRDKDSWMVGVSLRWEIFDGMRRRNEVARTSALRNSAAEYEEEYRSEVLLQVAEQSLRRQEALARLEVARHSVKNAEEGVRLVGMRFENSLATMVELLDAQTAFNRSRALLVESECDNYLATGRLYHAAGIFLREVGK